MSLAERSELATRLTYCTATIPNQLADPNLLAEVIIQQGSQATGSTHIESIDPLESANLTLSGTLIQHNCPTQVLLAARMRMVSKVAALSPVPRKYIHR